MTCPYCGILLNERLRTKEHVVGRRFIPKGVLENQWNLILYACQPCNHRKADLEDDIAAITMHFHAAGLNSMSDTRLQAEARRRGEKSGSRKTGKPVARSTESLEVAAPIFDAGELKISFAAPAQLDEARAFELARLQLLGFFYFITYQDELAVGHPWPGGFFPVHGTIKSDWGNPVHRAFMKETATWDYRFVLDSATGYYRAVIRRHPSSVCWSWAVEWNDAYRVVGFLGEKSASQSVANLLPQLPVRTIEEGQGRWLRVRTEEPLSEADDILFLVPEGEA